MESAPLIHNPRRITTVNYPQHTPTVKFGLNLKLHNSMVNFHLQNIWYTASPHGLSIILKNISIHAINAGR